jgi:hypothetical protein
LKLLLIGFLMIGWTRQKMGQHDWHAGGVRGMA